MYGFSSSFSKLYRTFRARQTRFVANSERSNLMCTRSVRYRDKQDVFGLSVEKDTGSRHSQCKTVSLFAFRLWILILDREEKKKNT